MARAFSDKKPVYVVFLEQAPKLHAVNHVPVTHNFINLKTFVLFGAQLGLVAALDLGAAQGSTVRFRQHSPGDVGPVTSKCSCLSAGRWMNSKQG